MTFAVLLADALDVRFGATTLTVFEPEVLVFMNRQDSTYIRYHASRVNTVPAGFEPASLSGNSRLHYRFATAHQF